MLPTNPVRRIDLTAALSRAVHENPEHGVSLEQVAHELRHRYLVEKDDLEQQLAMLTADPRTGAQRAPGGRWTIRLFPVLAHSGGPLHLRDETTNQLTDARSACGDLRVYLGQPVDVAFGRAAAPAITCADCAEAALEQLGIRPPGVGGTP